MTYSTTALALFCLLPSATSRPAADPVVSLARSLQAQQHDKARAELEQVQQLDPLPVRGSYLAYAQAIIAAGDEACALAEQGLEQLEGSAWRPAALNAVSACWRRAGERERALALADRVDAEAADKERCVQQWHRARLLEQGGRHKDAAVAYREVWIQCPLSQMSEAAYSALKALGAARRIPVKGKSSAEYMFAASKWKRTGKYQRAKSVYQQAVAKAQQEKDRAQEAEARLALAKLYIDLGHYRSVSGQLRSVIGRARELPDHAARAQILMADIYSRTNRVGEAYGALESAMARSDNTEPVLRAHLDHAELSIKVHDLARARATLAKLLSRVAGETVSSPAVARARWLDAWLAWRSGGMNEASEAIAHLMENHGDRAKVLYWLGRWHKLAGDLVSAQRYWALAQQHDPLGYYAHAARTTARAEGSAGDVLDGLGCEPADPSQVGPLLPTAACATTDFDALFEQELDVEGAAWFNTAHPDITSAQDLAARRLVGESQRWLKPVGSLDRSPDERLALAHIYLRQDQAFWANIIARHAIRPYLTGRTSTRLEERERAEACAALQQSCDSPALLKTPPEQASLGLRIAYPQPYKDLVVEASERNSLPAALIYAVIYEESAFNPEARSSRRARGLMQLINRTAYRMARLEKLKGFGPYKLFTPEVNIQLGARYLAELWRRYDGVPALVYAAYHAGEKTVDKWVRERGELPLDAFIEEIPYSSTKGYVKKCTATTATYERLYFPDQRLLRSYDEPLPATLRAKIQALDPKSPLAGAKKKKPTEPASQPASAPQSQPSP